MESPWSIESIPVQASQVDMLEMFERDGVVTLEDLLTEGRSPDRKQNSIPTWSVSRRVG